MALAGPEYIRRAERPFTIARTPSSCQILFNVLRIVEEASSYKLERNTNEILIFMHMIVTGLVKGTYTKETT